MIKKLKTLLSTHPYKSVTDSIYSLEFAFQKCNPEFIIKNNIYFNNSLVIKDAYGNYRTYAIDKFDDVLVISVGKASGKMLNGLFNILGKIISKSILITPKGCTVDYLDKKILKKTKVIYSTHPIPNKNSLLSASTVINTLMQIKKPTIIFFLISGGASSLIELPINGLNLSDIKQINKFLIMSGADIHEINIIRKHLSRIKGGKILKLISKNSLVLSLVLSDVVGDHLDTIGSGLTSADPTTFKDAKTIMEKYSGGMLKNKSINKIQKIIDLGISNNTDETLKPIEFNDYPVYNHIMGNNTTFCHFLYNRFLNMGYKTNYLGSKFDMPIFEYLKVIKKYVKRLNEKKKKSCFILGGETRLSISTINGKGGRNQEIVSRLLEYFLNMKINDFSLISIGTDGIDGNSTAAGGIISPQTIKNYKNNFADNSTCVDYLNNHDSYHLLKKLQSNIITGFTGMNYNDVCLYVINPK